MTAVQKKLGMSKQEAANNVKMEVKENVLTIQIALDVEGEASKSGKSKVIATTRGNQPLAEVAGAKLGINLYKVE